MTAEHRAAIQGGTDSEHLLHLILSMHEQMGGALFESLEAAPRRTIAICHETGKEPHLGLNVLPNDGARMGGSRWRRTLNFFEQDGAMPYLGSPPVRAAEGDYRALVIASEPIDGTAWPEIPERSVFEVTPDLRLQIEPLEEG
jgi:glutamine amidotransferase